MMRKKFRTFLAAMLGILSIMALCIGLAGCGVAVQSVSLNKTELTLEVGASETLIATVMPDDATNKDVSWTSSDDNIATVDADGMVAAVAIGKATITVKTDSQGKTATCEVTVIEKVPVSGVTLDKSMLNLEAGRADNGGEATLIATIAPAEATNKNVTWSSNNEAAVRVDANGKVTAVSAGQATITVTTEDGNKTDTCFVIVTEHEHTMTHAIDPQDNSKHLEECTDCGYTSGESVPHTTELISDGADGHHTECTAEGCGYSTESTPHSLEVTAEGSNNIYHNRACACGYSEQERHTDVDHTDENDHWRVCSACEYEHGRASHNKIVHSDENEHWYTCKVSDRQCAWESEHAAHEYSYTWLSDAASGHSAVCKECEYEITNEAHDTLGDDGECSKCGYKDAGEHECADNADATGYFDGLCDICGANLHWTFAGGTISAYAGTAAKISIPSEIDNVAVTAFGTVFKSNTNITDIIIPESVTTIAAQAFNGCTSLATAIIFAKATTIPATVFMNCSSLDWLVLSATITDINTNAFGTATSKTTLNAIYFLGSAEQWATLYNSGIGANAKTKIDGATVYYYSDDSADNGWHWKVDKTIPEAWHHDN